MSALDYGDLKDGDQFDYLIVGSGFGGSVSALRLAEKGYSVAVLESGRHFRDADFPRTNWDARRYLWLPKLFCLGLQRLTLLDDVLVLSGAGVGGGSLVYANTLLEPGDGFYASPEVRRLSGDLRAELTPHYATAKRMLGAARVPRLFPADEALRQVAEETGRGATFHAVDAAVFFGESGKSVPDPYFGGKGPERAGCRFCGGCMTGCRHNAKNTLTKNYLHLAQALGAKVFALTTARNIKDGGDEGFEVSVRRSGWGLGGKRLRARKVVVSAGVLGTLRLLLASRDGLPRLSRRLGRDVRTNAEVLSGSSEFSGKTDWSQGLAISAGMRPDDATSVEAVRYGAGCDAMSLLAVRDAPAATRLGRLARLAWRFVSRPLESARFLNPFGWAKRSTILLFMQTSDSRLRLALSGRRLRSRPEEGAPPPPPDFPAAAEVLKRFAEKTGGVPQVSVAGALLGVSTTAHILGGAVIGRNSDEGVVGLDGRAFGHEGLTILDGSIVPGNLGVNPSLTIAALAENALSLVPPRKPPR